MPLLKQKKQRSNGFKFHVIQGSQVYAKRKYTKASKYAEEAIASGTESSPSMSDKEHENASLVQTNQHIVKFISAVTKSIGRRSKVSTRRTQSSTPCSTSLSPNVMFAEETIASPESVIILDDEEDMKGIVPDVNDFSTTESIFQRDCLADIGFEGHDLLFTPPLLNEPCLLQEGGNEFGGLLERLNGVADALPIVHAQQEDVPLMLIRSESLEDLERTIRSFMANLR